MVKPRFKFDAFTDFAKERQIAQAEMKRYASSGSLVAFEPTLYGSITNPDYYKTVGAHSVPSAEALRAAYIRHDDHFSMWFSFNPGVSFTAGSGNWTMSVPDGVTVPGSVENLLFINIGTWQAFDSSTSTMAFGPIWFDHPASNRIRFLYPSTYPLGSATSVRHDAPFTWASDDVFGGFVSFPVM